MHRPYFLVQHYMLRHLTISNYALIDELSIDFPEGLTIITGETGAGKSILLGALGLLLGQRADTQTLQDKSKKCVVEASFQVKGYKLKSFFQANELDYDDTTTIRREINPEGKSRAFVNDTPVNLAVLKELGLRLVDVHSQHETLTLNDSAFQLDVVDAFAGNAALLAEYKTHFSEYKKGQAELADLVARETQAKKDLDYFQFQFTELESAQLQTGEQANMESELETLENAETIKGGLSKSAFALDGGEQSLLISLGEIKANLAQLARFNPLIAQVSERVNSSLIELKDILRELEGLESAIVHDPARIELLQEKLDTIYRLQQKHGVKTIEELIAIRESLSEKIYAIGSLEEQIAKTQKALAAAEKQVLDTGAKLRKKRSDAAPKIEKAIRDLLAQLGMPKAELKAELTAVDQPRETGLDKVTFLFSANAGSTAKPLDKVASGGELSRLMLSLKALITKLTALPTIIFDEIDTGISGDIAAKAGTIMEQMAGNMQVVVITHLPQVASKGNSHLFVYKQEEGKRTVTRIKALDKEERVKEIAKMLSAGKPGDAAMENAKELLGV
ncbi:MAG: DNA repair protein RecN (Recombination protein N) [Bacteroidetes bacterium]|nr:MAG: DNA repair protein RecN (Recombination protein N) [Bacteroidota bacterium]